MTIPNYNDPAHLERLRNKARHEIGEKEELIPEQIESVRKILEDEGIVHIPPPSTQRAMFHRCLRARKYNIERAAKTFRKLCVVRSNVSEVAELIVPKYNKSIYEKKFVSVLASRDPHGRQILFIRLDRWNPRNHSFDNILASLFLMLDEAVDSEDTQLNGLVILVDFKGFGLSHARHIGPTRIQAIVQILQDAYPARFKEIHFLNHPSIFNMFFAIAKPFLKEKMRKRIFFHGHDPQSLHKIFGKNILPTSLGGSLNEDEYADEELVKKLLSKDEYYENFLQVLKLKRDEDDDEDDD